MISGTLVVLELKRSLRLRERDRKKSTCSKNDLCDWETYTNIFCCLILVSRGDCSLSFLFCWQDWHTMCSSAAVTHLLCTCTELVPRTSQGADIPNDVASECILYVYCRCITSHTTVLVLRKTRPVTRSVKKPPHTHLHVTPRKSSQYLQTAQRT